MGLFQRTRRHNHLIPIHPHNVGSRDWLILLEAGTIVGPSPESLRVALATQELKIVVKRTGLLKRKAFLVVDEYDPRIHAVYFCPQLYRCDSDNKLVPLPGEEIGKLIAKSIEGGVTQRRIWYEPLEKLPEQPIVGAPPPLQFDTVVVDMASARNSAANNS
jgi:hypothetical protein